MTHIAASSMIGNSRPTAARRRMAAKVRYAGSIRVRANHQRLILDQSRLREAVGASPFERSAIRRARVDSLEESHQAGMAGIEAGSMRRSFERETHLDVGGGELGSGKPRVGTEFTFHEIQLPDDVRIHECRQHLL